MITRRSSKRISLQAKINCSEKYASEICDPLKIKIYKNSLTKSCEKTLTKVKSKKINAKQVKKRRKIITSENEESDDDFVVKTKNNKNKKAVRNTIQFINEDDKKIIKKKVKSNLIKTKEDAVREGLIRLHSSAIPDYLPCREDQFNDIYNFVEQKLIEGDGGCMYISGVPGTGKTATLHEVIRRLKEDTNLPQFQFIEINALKLGQPSKFASYFVMQLTGEKMNNIQATDMLNNRFKSIDPKKKFIILLVDELDYLRTKKQDILYHIFDWPNTKNSKLIVLAIANAMDLPERLLLNRVSSRLGLTRLSFQPYHFKELEQIVSSRLKNLKFDDLFESDALQLICRKVSAVSGDARRALDICRRSIEVTIADNRTQTTMADVNKALQEIFNSIKITRIRHASLQEQMFLRCLVQNFRSSGLEEAQFIDVYNSHIELCRFEGEIVPTTAELSRVATNLDLSKIILFEKSQSHLYRRVRLNISSNDIKFALNLED